MQLLLPIFNVLNFSLAILNNLFHKKLANNYKFVYVASSFKTPTLPLKELVVKIENVKHLHHLHA